MMIMIMIMMAEMMMDYLSARRSRATMAGAWTVLIKHD